ncbi:MAG: hypothetical protein ABMA13_23285 [Chthoniobacteraceae bacterium]
MNESEFENQLRALTPAAPSPDLGRRIAAAMIPSRTPAAGVVAQPRRSAWADLMRGLLWASCGAAAAALILLSRTPETTPAPASVAAAVPPAAASETVSELIATADDGLVFDEDSDEPQRQMRFTYLERHVWTNPQTGAVIEFEVPREDIVLMPVAMQ